MQQAQFCVQIAFVKLFHLNGADADRSCHRESTSIPVNPRTERPVGYAFVDLESADDAQKAITNLSGKEVLERKVSVQLARKPESGVDAAGNTTGEAKEGEDGRKRGSGRGRTRGRGRGGRSGRGGRVRTSLHTTKIRLTHPKAGENGEVTDAQPLTDVTNEANQANAPPTDAKDARPRAPRPPKQRGPPEDGIPSTNKVMVANLPYDLSEDKVCSTLCSSTLLTKSPSAQGTLRCLRTGFCQDCSSSHSSLHGQEASAPQ